MSKETPAQPSNASKEDDGVGIAQVQNLLHAVQRGLGGAHDKYQVLENEFKQQQTELTETKTENGKLKKKLQKLMAKMKEMEDGKNNVKEETASGDAPFRPSRVKEAEEAAAKNTAAHLKDVYLNPLKRLPPKLIRGKCGNPFAFCVLVMNRDAYALGAAVLAHRIKKLNSKADIVCMVTRDVSLGVVEALASEFHAVFQVPYLEYSCRKMTTRKQQNYYGSWIERSFTKWNALALTMYKKVVLLDADLLPVSNIDQLFEMSAPAATFSSPWARTYRKDGYDDPFKGLRHGDLVEDSRIKEAIRLSLNHSESVESKGSYMALGSLVLLEPNIVSYSIFNAFVCSQQPFGIPGCHSGFDEQSIVLFYYLQNPETKWTHISQGYNALSWHEQWLEGCDIKCYHYFNAKPWELRPDVYPDLKMWYRAAHELTQENIQCGYLTEVCMSDTSFIDVYLRMASDKEDMKENTNKASALKPVLALDGTSDGSSRTSSPRVEEAKAKKYASSESQLQTSSTCFSDEASDPPKLDGNNLVKSVSISSDGDVSKLSETTSVRSRDSRYSAGYVQKRPTWYDEYERPPAKDVARVRASFNRRRGSRSPSARVTPSEDYVAYSKDARLHKGSHRCSEACGSPSKDYRRLAKTDSLRIRPNPSELFPQPRVSSDVWMPRRRAPGAYWESAYERASRHHVMSHSPVNPRSMTRFESFGSSTSSGSHRLTPKHDRRQQF